MVTRTTSSGALVGEFDSSLMNVHFEFDWQPPLYSLEHSFGFLAELFYSSVERHDGTLDQFGGYALTQYALNANFAIGARPRRGQLPRLLQLVVRQSQRRGRPSWNRRTGRSFRVGDLTHHFHQPEPPF